MGKHCDGFLLWDGLLMKSSGGNTIGSGANGEYGMSTDSRVCKAKLICHRWRSLGQLFS